MNFIKKLFSCLLVAVLFAAQATPQKAFAAGSNALPKVAELSQAINAGDLNAVVKFVNAIKSAFPQDTGVNYTVNLDFYDAEGHTPLTRAASLGRADILKYLLTEGADPYQLNAAGETPAMAAAKSGYTQIASILAPKAPPVIIAPPKPAATPAAANSGMLSGLGWGKYALVGAAAVGAAVAAAGTGGGGSGGDTPDVHAGLAVNCGPGAGLHPEDCDELTLLTAESAGMEGIAAMKANFSLARGYDGRIYDRDGNGDLVDESADGYVKVAVIDTGIDTDHPELDGNILANSAVTCNYGVSCTSGGEDVAGHGTNVASIIAAERNETADGMHGVAPLAKIIPIRAVYAGGSVNLAFHYANTKDAQVINNSWGYNGPHDESVPIIDTPDGSDEIAWTPQEVRDGLVDFEAGKTLLGGITNAVDDHRIIVFAAGNSSITEVGVMAGLPYYFRGDMDGDLSKPTGYDTVNPGKLDFSQNWISVVSLQNDNTTLSSFSNQCGVAKNWCIAAPGEMTTMAAMGGGYESGVGTSYSAPNVSGAVAAMLGAFPHLTPEEVVEIIFDTADDLGVAGIDDVFGHGLVNLQKASDPSDGGWTITSFGSSFSAFGSSSLNLSAPFGNAIAANHATLMFQDKYNKDYTLPLSFLAHNLYQREDNTLKLARLNNGEFTNRLLLGENSQVNYSMVDKNRLNDMPNYYAEYEMDTGLRNLSYLSTIGDAKENMTYNFNYKMSVADAHSASALSEIRQSNLSVTQAFKNPYLGFAKTAKSSIIGYNTLTRGLTLGVFDGDQNDDYAYNYQENSGIRGMFAEYTCKTDGAKVSFTAGTNIEENTFLGSEASGAFDMQGGATTNYTGVAARYDLTNDLALVGNYNIGVTNAQMGPNSLFSDMGNIIADSFALGAEYNNFADTGGKLGFNVSQPLRVLSGHADANLPVDIDNNGSILFDSRKLSLAPTARQIDFETYYGLAVSDTSKFALSGVVSTNPGNLENTEDEGLLLLKFSYIF